MRGSSALGGVGRAQRLKNHEEPGLTKFELVGEVDMIHHMIDLHEYGLAGELVALYSCQLA